MRSLPIIWREAQLLIRLREPRGAVPGSAAGPLRARRGLDRPAALLEIPADGVTPSADSVGHLRRGFCWREDRASRTDLRQARKDCWRACAGFRTPASEACVSCGTRRLRRIRCADPPCGGRRCGSTGSLRSRRPEIGRLSASSDVDARPRLVPPLRMLGAEIGEGRGGRERLPAFKHRLNPVFRRLPVAGLNQCDVLQGLSSVAAGSGQVGQALTSSSAPQTASARKRSSKRVSSS